MLGPIPASSLPLDQQQALAVRFAPALRFDPAEEFFPCSPRLWLEAEKQRSFATVAQYLQLSLPEKLARATVFFRVYEEGRNRVIEYWFYYPFNRYRAGAGLLPFSSDVSHANDLEFIFLVLEPAGVETEDWRVVRIVASAHRINNLHRFLPDEPRPSHIRFLVERGSHANCPDLDDDGSYTPAREGRSSQKIVWGIRDSGSTWAWTDQARRVRSPGSAIDLNSPHPVFGVAPTYRLEPVEVLAGEKERILAAAPENHRNWATRLFGNSEGRSAALVLPPSHENYGRIGRAENNHIIGERGLLLGITPILHYATGLAGGRFSVPTQSRFVPDLVLQGQAMISGDGNDYYQAEVLGYYPIDALTNFFGGVALLGDSLDFDDRQVDWLAGVEWRVGHFRFRQAFRSTGPVSSAWCDFRVCYLF